MKLYLAASTIFFFLFVVFFVRRLPGQNPWFAAWLLAGVTAQIYFAVILAFNVRGISPTPRVDLAIQILGWCLIAAAMLRAHRSASSANQIIFTGLAGLLVLQSLAIALAAWHGVPHALRALVSNIAVLAPTLWMLGRFLWTWPEALPLWAANSRLQIEEAFGFARGLIEHTRALLG